MNSSSRKENTMSNIMTDMDEVMEMAGLQAKKEVVEEAASEVIESVVVEDKPIDNSNMVAASDVLMSIFGLKRVEEDASSEDEEPKEEESQEVIEDIAEDTVEVPAVESMSVLIERLKGK